MDTVTVEVNVSRARTDGPPVPGAIFVFTAGKPVMYALPVTSVSVELGRESMPAGMAIDPSMSRRHARIACEDGTWRIADLGSHNGTSIDDVKLEGERTGAGFRVLRLAQTVCLLEPDVRPFMGLDITSDPNMVMGHHLQALWRLLAQLTDQPTLHIHGESGSGKELAARAFHDRGPNRGGPFVAVNCAAIPATLAEAMLFGARKGAFSGADRDIEGLFPAADGGTLFLDEIGELDLVLQAKLLRALETREVLAVGASRPRAIDVRVCSASHRELKTLVAQGKFRDDLFFRVGRPEIVIPPLRERREEIAALVCRAIGSQEPALDATLIETCLVRPWPGNIRELHTEVRHAAQLARAENSPRITAAHVGADAGTMADAAEEEVGTVEEMPSREKILEALRAANGKVATAARVLGIPRIRLRRWIDREGIDPTTI
ncbi:MAG: sigma 54-interacting transcriptional regulator [Myxococcota bacterium]|nr:sigma 54-interacting transcriptional regulator [Myxococcota bacterium]